MHTRNMVDAPRTCSCTAHRFVRNTSSGQTAPSEQLRRTQQGAQQQPDLDALHLLSLKSYKKASARPRRVQVVYAEWRCCTLRYGSGVHPPS